MPFDNGDKARTMHTSIMMISKKSLKKRMNNSSIPPTIKEERSQEFSKVEFVKEQKNKRGFVNYHLRVIYT